MLVAACESGIWTSEPVEGTEHSTSFSTGCPRKRVVLRMKKKQYENSFLLWCCVVPGRKAHNVTFQLRIKFSVLFREPRILQCSPYTYNTEYSSMNSLVVYAFQLIMSASIFHKVYRRDF